MSASRRGSGAGACCILTQNTWSYHDKFQPTSNWTFIDLFAPCAAFHKYKCVALHNPRGKNFMPQRRIRMGARRADEEEIISCTTSQWKLKRAIYFWSPLFLLLAGLLQHWRREVQSEDFNTVCFHFTTHMLSVVRMQFLFKNLASYWL